ncbi:MAG TPA: arsenate reductase ArsC [Candidatus Thermoplasmatota archaeon]|nr:arsenate reductase ArsC [Candidatus Thermoplasmatota archaeon]
MEPKRVLFACVGNSFRSQIAEGFAKAYAKPGTVDVRSGGTNPSGVVHGGAIRIMKERGIDISRHASKIIDLEFADRADAFITLCGPMDDACPARIAKKAIDWNLPDPSWSTEDEQRRIRDTIEERVKRLLEDWRVLRADLP